MRIRWRIIIAISFAALVVAFFAYADGYFSFENIQHTKGILHNYVDENPVLSAIVFGLVYAAAVALSLPISLVMSILGGFLFGAFFGAAIIVIGATAGAVVVFLLARYLFYENFQRRFGPRIKKINYEFSENGFSNLLFVRLMPVIPFFIANIAPAFTPIKIRDYILATVIGTIPATYILTNAGKELAQAEAISDIVSPYSLLSISLVAVILFVPMFYIRWKKRKNSNKIQATTTDGSELDEMNSVAEN